MDGSIAARRAPVGALAILLGLLVLAGGQVHAAAAARGARAGVDIEGEMSPMGALARRVREALAKSGGDRERLQAALEAQDDGGMRDRPAGGQAEVSIAVDATGRHVVIGFNDTRGFRLNPIRVSGYAYSDDGGKTFVDGGQLPSPGDQQIGNTLFPQVFGDPDVRYMGGCTFIYASILLETFSPTTVVQTLGLHRSTDCGHTWEGPFVIPAASNPSDQIDPFGNPTDAADKEFIAVDPDTNRVLATWTNFTPSAPGGVQILATYSDDVLTATPPTWSEPILLGQKESDGQSTVPRFAGQGSPNAYVVWRSFPGPVTNAIEFARSTDNGTSFEPAVDISGEFKTMDQVLGNDRVNTSPGLAVDTSGGRHTGTIYVVYSNNDLDDGADIAVQVSRDEGRTFTRPRRINARPGHDRAQWFPWVTVDIDTGRAHVYFYDQGVAASGDRTTVSHTWSDDGGHTWSRPRPLVPQFKAGWGNDTGQPNLGDYNQAVAQKGELFAAFGYAFRPPDGFVDGQPSTSLTVPDVVFRRVGDDGDGIFSTIDGDAPPAAGPLGLAFGSLGAGGIGALAFPPFLGFPEFTPLLAEDFESVPPGALPQGWASAHGAGQNAVPWTTDATFCGGSNAAFHQEENDGPEGGSPSRWERLIGPAVTVPPDADWVLLEFDACYDTEDDPLFDILAYDGFFLRVTDLTPGHTLRSVLAEAFEDVFLTGTLEHYPKHFPRNRDPYYFEDMSAWAGDSRGVRRVRMLLPGMAGTVAQLRFEYTQDAFATCADVRPGHRCGVAIDNLRMTAIALGR